MAVKTVKEYGHQAFRLLQIVFVVAPIVAGLDKFFYILANWSVYISPFALSTIHFHDRGFMMIVGIVEIIVGIMNIFKPRVFAYITAIWLALIIINLLMIGRYYDIALRDFGLFLSAIAFGRLSQKYA